MARSSYIYVVKSGERPVAAFTVKHEMLSWLARRLAPVTAVLRLPDGGRGHWHTLEQQAGADISADVEIAPLLTPEST